MQGSVTSRAVGVAAPPDDRALLVRLLIDGRLRAAAAADTVAELIAADRGVDAVVAVADPATPEGEHDIRALVRELPDAPLTVVMPLDSSRLQRLAIDLGADGIVFAHEASRTLVATVVGTLAGQLVVPAEMRRRFGTPPLSHREKQVLGLVARGYTNGLIARELYLSESTVKSHLSSCFEKLGVRSRREAASVAVDPNSGLGLGVLSFAPDERVAVNS